MNGRETFGLSVHRSSFIVHRFEEVAMTQAQSGAPAGFVEEVELQGHVIDSLILPKVLDEILTRGGTYVVRDIKLGQRQTDPSYVKLQVRADTPAALEDILNAIHEHGAVPVVSKDCEVAIADIDGAFPERFYSTTNYRTQVRSGGTWID